ncbi:hypothetical protein [Falsirhodobacter deserti]|uniref:hypothetical protein n=1 Tax=Falsirhodobacter deserti TaxID=1365611 RepID=UPI000FE38956|nr:hypothetical protein [Falsirhodobacter deserti]
MTPSRLTNAAVLASLMALPAAAQEHARFRVTDDVVASRSEPFTATIDGIGNGNRLTPGGGFEPVILRTMFVASGGDGDTVLADATTLSNWDSWTEGTFDGAEIEVLRIENGQFVSVRQDRIPEGGYHASGWTPLNRGKAVPADRTTFLTGWDNYNRLGVPYYYTVRAIDDQGRLSPAAPAVDVVSPAEPGKVPDAPTLDLQPTEEGAAALGAPSGLQARLLRGDGVAQLEWQPVEGAAGYVIYRSDLPEDQQRGYSIDLAGDGPAVQEGDLVMLRKRITDFDRTHLVTNRVWGAAQARTQLAPRSLRNFGGDQNTPPWTLVAHDADTSVEEAGETFLRVDLPGGKPLVVGDYNHSGTDQTWYEVLDPSKPYRFEVWLRGSDTATASFALEGPFGGKAVAGLPKQLALTPEWQKHVVDFSVPEIHDGKRAGRMALTLSGKGQVDVDNFRVYRADAPYLGLLPEDEAALKEAAPSALRTHAFSKLAQRTYDLAQLTDPGGLGSVAGGNTLPQTLEVIEAVESTPWLQIQPHFSREEWLGLAEYLAAPADAGPWAEKRAAQGQTEPWTDVFDRIYLEIGNETWNGLFKPWVFSSMKDAATGETYGTGEVYGLYQEYVLSILEESPVWDALEPRLVPVLGGWVRQSYGFDAARRSPRSRILTHADYIGGWDQGEGPVRPTPEGFASVLAHSPQRTALDAAEAHEALEDLPARDVPLQLGTYESGPGYAMNGLNGTAVTPEQAAEQEKVMKSVAAGTATLDTFLTRMRNGDTIQNYFTFDRGDYWKSHAVWYQGGQPYPSWAWLALLNTELLGDMLKVEAEDVPSRDLEAMGRRKALDDAAQIDVQALRQDDRLSVIVMSRLVPGVPEGQDGHASVEVDLPISAASSLTRYSMTGDYDDNNIEGEAAKIVAEDLPVPAAPSQLRIDDLPPGEVLIYVFDGIE